MNIRTQGRYKQQFSLCSNLLQDPDLSARHLFLTEFTREVLSPFPVLPFSCCHWATEQLEEMGNVLILWVTSPRIAVEGLASPCGFSFCRMISLRCQWGCEGFEQHEFPSLPAREYFCTERSQVDWQRICTPFKRTFSLFLLSSGWTTLNMNSNGPYQSEHFKY